MKNKKRSVDQFFKKGARANWDSTHRQKILNYIKT